jgi:hypothetical protein
VTPEPKDKAEDEPKVRPKTPLEYRRFEEILNKVIKAPPMRRCKNNKPSSAFQWHSTFTTELVHPAARVSAHVNGFHCFHLWFRFYSQPSSSVETIRAL